MPLSGRTQGGRSHGPLWDFAYGEFNSAAAAFIVYAFTHVFAFGVEKLRHVLPVEADAPLHFISESFGWIGAYLAVIGFAVLSAAQLWRLLRSSAMGG